MRNIDKAIEILQKTEDGNSLLAQDLSLVQTAVNGGLSELGEATFAKLYESVIDGSYAEKTRWFHGIEHLTKDHQGYVYWKGKHVEHYSFNDYEREAAAAARLAERCQTLEEIGLPVNGRTTINPDCYEAPGHTVWKLALTRYYAFFRKEDQIMGLFYRMDVKPGEPPVVGAYKDETGIKVIPYIGASEGFHAAQDAGWIAAPISRSYDDTAELLCGSGLSAEELEKIIKGT